MRVKGLTTASRIISQIRNYSWYFPFLVWTHRYDRRGVKPGLTALILSLAVRPRSFSIIYRRWLATRLPPEASNIEPDGGAIELLIVSHSKDFVTLPTCIKAAVASSLNTVSDIVVVVPDLDVQACQDLLILHDLQAKVVAETSLLPEALVGDLKSSFGGARHGWILQQLLAVSHCLRSESKGVLLVDADTILTHPRSWINSSGVQPLLVSSEYTPDYYAFLEEIGVGSNPPKHTFVTHHMLFQPEVFRELLGGLSVDGFLGELGRQITDSRDRGRAAFCVEFELYAQHLLKAHPSRYQLVKFANRPVYGEFAAGQMVREAQNRQGVFSSVSFHAYLRS